MNNVQDLNIKTEILPLFDYSLNMFAKAKILDILQTPLSSRNQIVFRQNILKGFAANKDIVTNYSYTVLYLNEVHFFINNTKLEDLTEKKIAYRFFTSRRAKARYTSKFNQLILLFHRLETYYFSRIDVSVFPEAYGQSIIRIIDFLSQFQLVKHEHIVREHQLKDTHVMNLTKIIADLGRKKRITRFWEDLFLFEAYVSIHKGLQKHAFVFPSFTEKGIRINQLFHPLIDNPVKNDFRTSCNVVVLNGPNMSGKSTFLKAIGLCIYFGHLGLGIPAARGEFPFFTEFSIAINRRDDILNGYSHFMTEIINLKKVVQKAFEEKNCFAVFDELFSGTNVEDALEICKTTINGLRKFKNSYFFISTHIQELQKVSYDDIDTFYIECKLVNDRPTFTYKLKKGWSEVKVGRVLFDKEGLNILLR
ncbi:hypothetical protein [uncultured Kriegella sp.]|uniref:MutS-related protein n=1 Tax=uncultured Kriegella sp. TaxID=1798910 RepID=UPI0030D9A10B|tara:strand:- start:142129 stop:143391 length:1263 start_codon:yes stop_codon:yes gene_type:complete